MNLGELSIRRGVTTAMIYVCLAGFGAFSLWRLPLNRLPEVDLPVVAVITSYTGASPQDMETLVTEPIERAVASVENVESIRSSSRQGTSIVLISFTWGTDMDAAEIEVRKNLELFAGELLPDETSRPLTFAFDPSLAPIVFMAVDGPYDAHRLRQIATEQVQPYLGRLEGVAAAEVIGGLDREVQVLLRTEQLQALGISPQQVIDALRAGNVIVPSGAVDDGTQQLNLQPTGMFRNVREMEDVVVGVRGGRQVLLREVAEVRDTFEEETHVVTADGAPAVLMAVRKQSDANTVQVARAVREELPTLERRLPDGVRVVPLFDQAESIVRAITNLANTGLQAFLLTGLVLLAFLRSWRTSLIAVIAVPSSVMLGFTAMDALDVTLNLISMAGLALAIGMLVDNGIVVLEAAFQQIEKGATPREAAILGAREMAMPLVASTLTTVVVFLPILLVEGIAGELFRDLVLTITVTLLASLLIATTLVPLMASKLIGRDHESGIARALTRATRVLDRIRPWYERRLRWALARRKRVLGVAVVLFAASVAAIPILGQDFLPKADISEIRIEVTAAPGTSIEQMHEVVDEVEEAIGEVVPEANVVTADYGAPEGFGALFGGTANAGTIRIKLPAPTQRRRTQSEIEEVLTERFREIADVDVQIASFSLGGSSGDVSLKLFSQDLDQLRIWGERLRDEIAGLEGVRESRFSMIQGSPEIQLTYDRERMRVLGLTPGQVQAAVSTHYQGTVATIFREGGDEYMVRVRGPRAARRDLDDLRYLPIDLPMGGTVPLGSISAVDDRLGATDIEHENQRRMATVDITASGMDLGGLTRRIEAKIEALDVPEDVQTEIGGTAEDLRDAFFKLAMALLAALALVYMVLASQFESLLEPFVIMFTVPLAIIGVVGGLIVTGTTLQVTALVGVILLGGVVVNNGIVLIDVIKNRVAEGADVIEAAIEAGRRRVRPILITSLTTIGGMIPLAFGYGDGAETWAPMARAVVGGMIVSTFLTLFVIPSLYVSIALWRRRRRERKDAGDGITPPASAVRATKEGSPPPPFPPRAA